MKQLFIILTLCSFLISCSEKTDSDKSTSQANISYELDTIMVNSGEEFISLNWSLTSSDMTQDEKYLYNFKTGANPTGLEIIDLESKNLEKVIPMSLDGPNGIRHPYISSVYVLPDKTYYLSNSYDFYHFDLEGNKLSTLTFANHEFEGEKIPENTRIDLNQYLSEDGKTLVTFYADQKLENAPMGFTVFDLENQTFYYKPLPILEELEKYRIRFYFNDQPAGGMFSSFHLFTKNDSLIFSNGGVNQLYFYDLKTDSLTHKSYSSEFTSYEITSTFPSRVDSEEKYKELLKEAEKEVRYGPLYFDDNNDLYWRFTKELDRMKGDTAVFKTVLTAFDPDFEQKGELLLQDDFVLPYKVFVRDGMIYTFLNIDDELAFVRLKPTITYE